jgi:DNA invertase Pin-like site-specific DNA recombinase
MGADVATKVTPDHLGRLAYLYVRQSTLRQVVENSESAERQYALRERVIALGWPLERICVIDSDQGRSGASTADREGFQRLVSDVGLGRAGIVCGLEVSRLARNNADWHRLLEICGLTGTLILDEDGLYDPMGFNDRLLLGLKGTMSEAELHILRARLRGGILSKARRGELVTPLPVGLVYDPAGRVVLDPDTAVQGALAHLFACFEHTGSARGVVKAFAEEGLAFPQRIRAGDRKGEVHFVPLRHWQVLKILHNPRYAGAFCFGRRQMRAREGKISYVEVPREEWIALIPDSHPGYIDWERFEANQARLAENAQARSSERRSSPPREGPALLQGLVVCGRCGNRMTVRYHSRRRDGRQSPTYACQSEAIKRALSHACQVVPGAGLDEAVAELLLETVTPLALEAALAVSEELRSRAEEADRIRARNVERARHEAELARRRYLSVDPDNRLVADTLEADWNERLRALADAQDEAERARESGAGRLSAEQREKVKALAADLPALWRAPTTPQRERKRMVRLLIEDVTLLRGEEITAHVRFKGGQTHTLTLPVPPSAPELRRSPRELIEAIDQLLDEHTEGEIAAILNGRGMRSSTGKELTAHIVHNLRRSHGLASRRDRLREKGMLDLTETAERLGVGSTTVKDWYHAGLLGGTRFNDKGECLYDPPGANAPAKQQGSKLENRAPASTSGGRSPGGAV